MGCGFLRFCILVIGRGLIRGAVSRWQWACGSYRGFVLTIGRDASAVGALKAADKHRFAIWKGEIFFNVEN